MGRSRTTFLAISLSIACAASASAQTTASATVRRACSSAAPAQSLVTEPAPTLVYVPDDREVVNIEIESIAPFGGWVEETILSGYRGDGYFRWNGSNYFNTPGVDTLTFRFEIREQQEYLIRLRNQHNDPDPSAENDCWFRLDGGPWIKWLDNWGTEGNNIWSFNAFLETTAALRAVRARPRRPHARDLGALFRFQDGQRARRAAQRVVRERDRPAVGRPARAPDPGHDPAGRDGRSGEHRGPEPRRHRRLVRHHRGGTPTSRAARTSRASASSSSPSTRARSSCRRRSGPVRASRWCSRRCCRTTRACSASPPTPRGSSSSRASWC